jgi:hypothetical protein
MNRGERKMFTCKELLDAKELVDDFTKTATAFVKTQKSEEIIEERTFAEKYHDMSDKWLTKRRRFLLFEGFGIDSGCKRATDEKIEAVLTECDAIEAILEDREDKRLDYAASAQEYGG